MPHGAFNLVMTSPPATEPLTLSEAKTFLRIDHDTEDAAITDMIKAAREACESFTGLALITRGYSLTLDAWPADNCLFLPRPPLASVSAISVLDAAGMPETLDEGSYLVDATGKPGRIVLQDGAVPPDPGRKIAGIVIEFTAGYGAAASNVPGALRQGMKQIVSRLYTHRGEETENLLHYSGALTLFHPFRTMRLAP